MSQKGVFDRDFPIEISTENIECMLLFLIIF